MEYYSFSVDESSDGEHHYTFLSKDCVYTVVFNPSQYIKYIETFPALLDFGIGLSFFQFRHDETSKKRKDPKVGNTICKILIQYLESQEVDSILLYHCDHTDGKQKGRSKLFSGWHEAFDKDNAIVKHEVCVVEEGKAGEIKEYFIGYLALSNNPRLKDASLEFDKFSATLIDENK